MSLSNLALAASLAFGASSAPAHSGRPVSVNSVATRARRQPIAATPALPFVPGADSGESLSNPRTFGRGGAFRVGPPSTPVVCQECRGGKGGRGDAFSSRNDHTAILA